jgi:magnesium chelatase family protein
MVVEVASPSRQDLMADPGPPESPQMRARVSAARRRQAQRLAGSRALSNGDLSPAEVRLLCPLDPGARTALYAAHERLSLSVRAHDRILRVARTLADLEGRDVIARGDVAQAVAWRERTPGDLLAAAV